MELVHDRMIEIRRVLDLMAVIGFSGRPLRVEAV